MHRGRPLRCLVVRSAHSNHLTYPPAQAHGGGCTTINSTLHHRRNRQCLYNFVWNSKNLSFFIPFYLSFFFFFFWQSFSGIISQAEGPLFSEPRGTGIFTIGFLFLFFAAIIPIFPRRQSLDRLMLLFQQYRCCS